MDDGQRRDKAPRAPGGPESESRMTRLADLVFELGMLAKTPRSGYRFLGTGSESVAEHSYRTAMIGLILADLAGADASKVVLMCLLHDMHEARTMDFNYVAKVYDSCDRRAAMNDALSGTGLRSRLMAAWEEEEAGETLEASLARDADQLDLVASLKTQADLGNPYAKEWTVRVCGRLRTDVGRRFAETLQQGDHNDWWYARLTGQKMVRDR